MSGRVARRDRVPRTPRMDGQSDAGPHSPAGADAGWKTIHAGVWSCRRGRAYFSGPHDIPGLGITIAVISSGLVCYLLAWSMTSPVTRLRKAAQSLAAGDLSARTGAPAGGRRDEMTELMRDFDRMAERIEGLVDSQSRLLKDVSHELRSPLARLSVALGLARQRVASRRSTELQVAEPDRTGGRPAESADPATADHFAAGVGGGRPAQEQVVAAGTGGAGGARRRV